MKMILFRGSSGGLFEAEDGGALEGGDEGHHAVEVVQLLQMLQERI